MHPKQGPQGPQVQAQYLALSLQDRRAAFLIDDRDLQGPPGTGKTRTLLALLQILSFMVRVDTGGEQGVGAVLACADTNAATDNILQGLWEKGVNVVRLGRPSSVCLPFLKNP